MTDASAADLDFAYLTTTGRRTGTPHRIEIWFALNDGVVFLMAGDGERADWVRNLLADARVTLELGGETRETVARPITDPDDLSEWGRTAMPIALAWSPQLV